MAFAALGYLADLYDIVIFGVVRVASLQELGWFGDDNTRWGITLLNLQMVGMLVGGLFWGLLGDRLGRRLVLVSTIALFSAATLANAFVTDVYTYAVLRFVAGFGLAGELGAGITLVAELLSAHRRGYATTLIAALGLCGAGLAALAGQHLSWRGAYVAGGLLGLLVLGGRVFGLAESPLFRGAPPQQLRQLLAPRHLLRLLQLLMIGMPVWFCSALFVNLAPEYGRALGLREPISVAQALLFQTVGLAVGSLAWGLISERLRSRRRVLLSAVSLLALCALALTLPRGAAPAYAPMLLAIGLLQGYWSVYLSTLAEQFGSNLRATAGTLLPNVVRASTVPITLGVQALMPSTGLIAATLVVGALVFGAALLSLWPLRETYARDLDFAES